MAQPGSISICFSIKALGTVTESEMSILFYEYGSGNQALVKTVTASFVEQLHTPFH